MMETATMVMEPEVTEVPEVPAETPAEAPVEVPAEAAPAEAPAEEPAEEPAAEPAEEPAADDPDAVLNVERTDGAFGYVTVSGTIGDFRHPLVLMVNGGPETKFFSQPFPVQVIGGVFTMTIHLPPGGHKAVLQDAFGEKADATFDVV